MTESPMSFRTPSAWQDLKGIFLPVGCVFTGLTALLMSGLLSDLMGSHAVPQDAIVVMVAMVLHLVLWLPVGVVLLIIHWRRHRVPREQPPRIAYAVTSPDSVRHGIGWLTCVLLLLAGLLQTTTMPQALATIVVSVAVNLPPLLLFFGIGWALTKPLRCQSLPSTPRA